MLTIRHSIVVSISACHADDPGSIPGVGVFFTFAQIFIVRQLIIYHSFYSKQFLRTFLLSEKVIKILHKPIYNNAHII